MTEISSRYPTEDIEGIGPQFAALLSSGDVFDTHDLLLRSPSDLHGLVSESASEGMTEQWRAMAGLLQVKPVTAQWAEALVDGGVRSIEALVLADLEELRTLFADAVGAHTIPEAPNDDLLFDMLRDASTLHHTGTVAGRIVDDTGTAVGAAEVRIGSTRCATDARGKFRLLRIPLGRPHSLYIEHGDHGLFVMSEPGISLDSDTILESLIQLGTDATPAADVDEFDGETLPRFDGVMVTSSLVSGAPLREGDLLFVEHFYADGEHAKLASWFRAFIGGKIVVRTYKVPLSSLPDGCERRDTFQYLNGGLLKRPMGAEQAAEYRTIVGAMRRDQAAGIAPLDALDVLAQIRQYLKGGS